MKTFVKLVALLIAATVCASLLCACGSSSEPVMTLQKDGKTFTMTFSEYKTYLSLYKFLIVNQQDMYYYTYYGYTDGSGNVLLEGVGDDMFTDDLDKSITETVQGWIRKVLAERYLGDKYGITATDAQKTSNENYVNSLIKSLGGKGSFKQKMGCTPDEYLTFCESDNIRANLFDYLYGDEGIIEVTEKDTDDYYNNNYYAFRYLVIDLKNEVALNEDGTRQLNDDGTDFVRTKIDDSTEEGEEKLQNKSVIEDVVKSAVAEGTDFEELINKYSDDFTSVKYAHDGVIYSEYTDGVLLSFDDAILTSLASLKIGDVSAPITTVSENYIYFVERLELPEKAYSNADYSQWFIYEEESDDKDEAETGDGEQTEDETEKTEKETRLVNAFDDLVRDYLYEATCDELIATFAEDDDLLAKATIKSVYMPKLRLSRTSG